MFRKSLQRMRQERKVKHYANMRAAKNRKRLAVVAELRDVGGFVSDGVFGAHSIRCLARENEERWLFVSVDGVARRARTLNGVRRCLAAMVAEKNALLAGAC